MIQFPFRPSKLPSYKYLVCGFFLFFFMLFAGIDLRAEGVSDLMEEGDDPVMLLIGQDQFGDFAAYNSPEYSRLYIRIADPNEIVYLGLSGQYRFDGTPQGFGTYYYRIRRASDGAVVHGPIAVNFSNQNLDNLQQAEIGPDAINAGGYPVTDNYTFQPEEAGDYFIEFSSVSYIGFWDITVANNEEVKPGRIYSKNWTFRVPEPNPELPECVWGGELNAEFYSYTSDGFVSRIDFNNSGFKPLSFTLSFSRTGPGSTGDPLIDRMSVANENLTGTSAEHLIFLSEPDINEFPDGLCGDVTIEDNLQCSGDEGGYCIPVSVTAPGQVELILDFNGNQTFDDGLDVLLLHTFEDGDELSDCIQWDGLMGDGTAPDADATLDVSVTYTQGVQHWGLFDGEFMTNGFCVETVRPICGEGIPSMLYYDDRNIPEDPGTGAPKDVRTGCLCETSNCRTWTNFDAMTDDCSVIDDDITTGYGDKSTLNTWWFASINSSATVNMPLLLAEVEGPDYELCPGESAQLELVWYSPQSVELIEWFGPDGPMGSGSDLFIISADQPGVYQATVTDVAGCQFTDDYLLQYIGCDINAVVLSIECDDNGTNTILTDDTFIATVQITGTGDNGWSSDFENLSGNYGETIELGPYLIMDGDIDILFHDNTNTCCESAVTLEAPLPCSDGCAITSTVITDNRCEDGGTPLDPSDDVFLFDLSLTAINGASWSGSDGSSGNYDETYTFGPYPIADGQVQIVFTDDVMPECTSSITVNPPSTCSDSCYFIPEVSEVYCDDSGTPANPFDDVFYFNLEVEGVNANSLAFELEGLGLGLYGSVQTYGPFLISSGDLSLDIWDVGDESCSQTLSIPAPPSCSDECGVVIADIISNCDDLGTPEVEDDIYFYEILVNSLSSANTSWVANDGSSGPYGEYVRSVDIPYSSADQTIIVTDAGTNICSDSAIFTFPELTFDCPPSVNTVPIPASFQTVRGTLVPGRFYFNQGEELSCWLDENELQSGGRTYDRFTFNRPDTVLGEEPQLFTFYLFTDIPDAGTVGAIFQIDDEEPVDCCDLVNPGPVMRWMENDLQPPYIEETDHPEGLQLAQQFSLLVYPDRPYTVVTTTWNADVTGTYEWLIISMTGERLVIDNPFVEEAMDAERGVTFDLQTVHLPLLSDADYSMQLFGMPEVQVGCGLVNLTFEDVTSGSCDTVTLTRRFDAETVDSVLQGVCVQEIGFGYMGLDEITMPPQGFQFSCTESFLALPNGYPDPAFTGYPSVYYFGESILLSEGEWRDFVVAYEDEEVQRPDGGLNVYRTWTIEDLCKDQLITYTQLFKLDAAGNPQLVCPTSNHYCPIIEEDIMLFPTDTFECTADVVLPLPEYEDICDTTDWVITTFVFQIGESGDTIPVATISFEDEDRLIEDLPVGDYFIDYIGTLPDYEDLELTCRFRVADVSEPVAICLGYIDLPLTGSGTARLFADQVDWFSYDNCGIETYEVRRQYYRDLDSCEQTDTLYWGEWGPFVEFSCCDAGYQYDVELRVIDSAGLINFCTAEVNVYDGIRPYCVGLDNLDLTCNDLPDGFDPFDTTQLRLTFGMPEVIDNCSAYAVELDPIVTGDGCTPNGIVRRFLAVDEFGNEAFTIFTQVIMIDPVLDYSILFPRDTETDCVSFEDTVGVFNTACDSITISFEDVDIEVEGEECRHVARTYTVTNWCEWDGDSPAFVLSRDEECDFIEGDEDLWVIRRPDTVYLDANSDETDNFPAAGTSDVFCTGETNPEGYWRIVESTGRWQYTQHIRYFDTLAPVVELFLEDSLIIEDDTCEIEADFIINLAEACPFGPAEFELAYDIGNDGTIDGQYDGLENFDGELIGVYPDFIYREIFPIGTHRLELTASDACGNTVVESLVFQVYDGYVPPLTCYDYRLYELEQLVEPIDVDDDGEEEEAAVAVQAEELGSCLFDDCSGELTYSLNRVGETPDPDRSFLFLDCDDRYSVELEVYVWDAAFNPLSVQPDGSLGGRNWRSCVVTVWVQDPDLACDQCLEEEGLILSGTIRNSAGQRMEGVSVTLDELSSTMNTSSNGRYQFQLPAGSSDVLRAYKNDDTQDGLNTLDMLILNRHILGAQLLTTPHLLIAADINNDGEINILDMLELQRVILNVQDEFANNYSWRFVSSDWSGEYPPAEVHIEDMTACLFDINLTGIKIGDLDGSLTATPSIDGPVSARLQESVVANERDLVNGQRAEITFRLQDLSRFQGGQLGFQWDADRLEVEGLSSSSLADHNFNTSKLADGRLWFNWATTTGDELVTLQLKARARLNVQDEISLMTTELWASNAYRSDELEAVPLVLNWTDIAVDDEGINPDLVDLSSSANELLGNFPNPAASQTVISLRLVNDQIGRLIVVDQLGRQLAERKLELISGLNEITLDVSSWTNGWYAYRIELEDGELHGQILKQATR